MSQYGHAFDNFMEKRNEEVLSEAIVELYTKGNDTVNLYVRNGSEATRGANIPKNDKEAKLNHAASVKIRTPKELTGSDGIPVEIHSGKINWDYDKYKNLRKINSRNKKAVNDFLEDNLDTIDKLFYEHDDKQKRVYWKTIIDKSCDKIKNLTVNDNEIQKYFEEKQKELKEDKLKKKNE